MSNAEDEQTIGMWSVRFRFRLSKQFSSKENCFSHKVGDVRMTFATRGGEAFEEAEYVVLTAHGFEDRERASEFANRARFAVQFAALNTSNGADTGEDTGAWFSEEITDIFAEKGARLLSDPHGVQVFQRSGNEVRLIFSAHGRVTQKPDDFLSSFDDVVCQTNKLDAIANRAVEIMALAGTAQEPLAEAILYISAVEILASRPWSTDQSKLIDDLSNRALEDDTIRGPDALEVADAVKRIHRSIRQGIKSLMLSHLQMSEQDWKSFDKVYSLRSAIDLRPDFPPAFGRVLSF